MIPAFLGLIFVEIEILTLNSFPSILGLESQIVILLSKL